MKESIWREGEPSPKPPIPDPPPRPPSSRSCVDGRHDVGSFFVPVWSQELESRLLEATKPRAGDWATLISNGLRVVWLVACQIVTLIVILAYITGALTITFRS